MSVDFALRRPCPRCPFRTDVPAYLRRERCVEIASAIARGAPFACHETTVLDPDDDSALVEGPGSQFCAGALIVMENEGVANQMMRTAERLGVYDASKLDRSAPVHVSMAAFVAHHAGEDDDDVACCSYCGPDCEAPAGYLIDGVAVPAEATDVELTPCEGCGEPCCGACLNDGGFCGYCDEEGDDDD